MKYGLSFLPKAHEQFIFNTIQSSVNSWIENWFSSCDNVNLTFSYFNQTFAKRVLDDGILCINDHHNIGFFCFDKSDLSKLFFSDYSIHIKLDEIFEHLYVSTIASFVNTVLFNSETVNKSSTLSKKDSIESEYPILVFNISFEHCCFEILVDSGIFFSQPPEFNTSMLNSLASRKTVISDLETKVNVNLPFLNTSIGSLIGLQTGDIIKSNVSLSEPFLLRVNDTIKFKYLIGSKNGCYAIKSPLNNFRSNKVE